MRKPVVEVGRDQEPDCRLRDDRRAADAAEEILRRHLDNVLAALRGA